MLLFFGLFLRRVERFLHSIKFHLFLPEAGLLPLQIPLQQEGAEVWERGDRLRFADVGMREFDAVADGRIFLRLY